MKRVLVQTQLSNYNTYGKFLLECDSGWQMVIGRAREMLRLNSELHIDVMGPRCEDLITPPWNVNPDLLWSREGVTGRLKYLHHDVVPNALATRYNFDLEMISMQLGLGLHRHNPAERYDAVYINDPMHLRNFKAMFHLKAGYVPRFYVHSHFVDVPSCPKFPTEASLWLGQCEAALKADWNFWQCETALKEFKREAKKLYTPKVVKDIMARSSPWDDGYSQEEITSPVNEKNMRFTSTEWEAKTQGKIVIFVPNRIGGKGRSSDYTNCGKFMFELLPELRKHRQDFVVVCGNPSQKIFNHELEQWCAGDGYVNLVPGAFNRDEFKFIAHKSHIALGLYDQDTYGGTAARECTELGCMPLWLDINEYSVLSREAGGYPFLCKPDFSDLVDKLSWLIDSFNGDPRGINRWRKAMQKVVRSRCSYKVTTRAAMKKMDLL